MAPTPAIRALEEAGVRFALHEYEHDPKSASYGAEAADKLDVEIDASALEHETILVNGGRRGLQIELDPRALVRLTDARVHEIASRPMGGTG